MGKNKEKTYDFTYHYGSIIRRLDYMNIYDKINDLTAALRVNPEVVAFRDAANAIKDDAEKTKILEDFRQVQIAAYHESVEQGKVSEETTQRMQSFATVIQTTPEINDYLQAEIKFSMLFEDMMKSINEAVGVDVIGAGQ